MSRLQRSLLVAAIAAAAAVAAAWLSAWPHGPNTDNQAGPHADDVIGVVITHVSVSSVIAGRITLDVTGTAEGLSVEDEIYAIARRKGDQAPTEASGEPRTWLVAEADRQPGGGWTAHIVVRYEQRRAFTVVAVLLEGCPPGALCSPRPPEAKRDKFGKLGPDRDAQFTAAFDVVFASGCRGDQDAGAGALTLAERHLHAVLAEYVRHYDEHRPSPIAPPADTRHRHGR